MAPTSACIADEEVYTLTEDGLKKYRGVPPSATGVVKPSPSPPSMSNPKPRPYSDITVLMYMADW